MMTASPPIRTEPAIPHQRPRCIGGAIGAMLLLLASQTQAAQAEKSKLVVVGPGTNADATITEEAETGDKLIISFNPTSGWRFTINTEVDDSAKLGWRRNGNHSFRLDVRADLAQKTYHTARFHGEMAPDGGSGGGPGSPASGVITWEINGKFKLLYDHEGVGSDFKRSRPGALVSKKPEAPAVDAEVATHDAEQRRFIGTFRDGNGFVGLGLHTGAPDTGEGTDKSIDLHGKGDDHQDIDCPEGDKAKVVKVYLGVNDAGGIGGRPFPDPDTIQLNTFSNDAELAQAKKDLAAAEAAKKTADDALTKAKAEQVTAEADVAKKKADVEAAITKIVAKAQAEVTAKEKALAQKQSAEQTAKAAFDAVVAFGATASSARYRQAKTAYDAATTARKTAEGQLATAQQKLANARGAAESDPSVVAARTALATAETKLQEKKAAVTKAETTVADAETAVDKAADLVDSLTHVKTAWANARASVLIHEQGHRRILHAHIDKMTTMLNTLRVWGYAVKEARAKTIAEIEFRKVRFTHVKAIRALNDTMQGEGSGYDGVTIHGTQQERWTNWPNGSYP